MTAGLSRSANIRLINRRISYRLGRCLLCFTEGGRWRRTAYLSWPVVPYQFPGKLFWARQYRVRAPAAWGCGL